MIIHAVGYSSEENRWVKKDFVIQYGSRNKRQISECGIYECVCVHRHIHIASVDAQKHKK